MEGQAARGVFILCVGHVKLSTSAGDGRTLILHIAEPGDLLGLPATISGRAYEVTADVMEPAQANFISHGEFLNFLRDHGEAALRVAQELSEKLSVGFCRNAHHWPVVFGKGKLARFDFGLEQTTTFPRWNRKVQPHAYPRRDRSDDRGVPGNGDADSPGTSRNKSFCRLKVRA